MAEILPDAFIARTRNMPVLRLTVERELGSGCQVQCVGGIGLPEPEVKYEDGQPLLSTWGAASIVVGGLVSLGPDLAASVVKFEPTIREDVPGIAVVNHQILCANNISEIDASYLTQRLEDFMAFGKKTRTFAGYVDLGLLGGWATWAEMGREESTRSDQIAVTTLITAMDKVIKAARTLASQMQAPTH